MRRSLMLGLLLVAAPALAQTPAPPAGSDGGGPVGPSTSNPIPQPHTPPGTPNDQTGPDRQARDATGQSVIGHTSYPPNTAPASTEKPQKPQ